jgi:hypothetical protein
VDNEDEKQEWGLQTSGQIFFLLPTSFFCLPLPLARSEVLFFSLVSPGKWMVVWF